MLGNKPKRIFIHCYYEDCFWLHSDSESEEDEVNEDLEDKTDNVSP